MTRPIWLVLLASCCTPDPAKSTTTATTTQPPPGAEVKDLAVPGEVHLKNVHALTFGADNAEAYWSFAGDRLIMQTNHKPYKCDQIEEMPSSGGPAKLVSTGKGRTTCSYFLKGDKEIIYASTDENSPECPTPPDMSKGYYWGLFEYDIYRANADGSNRRKLTGGKGYDAEATVCPVDGSIIFTSTRSGDLELWRMDANGTNLKQLTDTPGYDGGAVWSPDCSRIAWRASRPKGKALDEYKELLAQNLVKPTSMDLWVANADGSDARQVTYLPGASFGPFFYPSGRRIIFASNYVNPRGPEFDLYGIDIDGSHLERLTFAEGFDGFPMFSPDGKKLSFSSNRRNDIIKDPKDGKDVYRITGGPAGEHDTNVFVADWDGNAKGEMLPVTAAADRFIADVGYLADDAQEGRGVGTKGLERSLDYVQKAFEAAGVEPGLGGKSPSGEASRWRQPFEVTVSVEREAATAMTLDGAKLEAADFAPLPYSKTGKVSGAVIAIGSGIVDPDAKIDDYKGKDVRGKIVVLHEVLPPDVSADVTRKWSGLRRRVFVARGKGAAAVIAVDDGDLKRDEAKLPMLEPSHGDAGIPVVAVTRKAMEKAPKRAELVIALKPVKATTENVVGVIRAGAATKLPGIVVVGAHVDHLGMGGPNALDTAVGIHNGADDNASGTAGLLEVARTLAAKKAELPRDVYLVSFSAEEMGVLGSAHYVKNLPTKDPIVAMINMDMIGRMQRNHLSINGGESAKEWKDIVAPVCDAARVDCSISGSGYGPSDHMSFYIAGIPVLFLFTGNHRDYHTMTDDTDKINAIGGSRAAMIAADTAFAVAKRPGMLTYVKSTPDAMPDCKDPKDTACQQDDRPRNASLGTIPSYEERDKSAPPGLIISGVSPGGPAEKAGLKGGDRIVDIGGTAIDNINDLMFVLQAAKPGQPTTVTYVRDGKRATVEATYGLPRRR